MKLLNTRRNWAAPCWALLLLTLASCASSRPAMPAYEPPRIACEERAEGAAVPALPSFKALPTTAQEDAWWRAYVGRMSAVWARYARALQGGWEMEIEVRGNTADCIEAGRGARRWR